MYRVPLLTILCVAAAFPLVSGTATLVPRLSSAACTGHFSDLSITSITCDYDNHGCTHGSEVFVTGEVTVDADLPRPLKISAYKTLPHFFSVGTRVYANVVDDICDSGTLVEYPDFNDDSHTCPGAGLYKFNFVFSDAGSRQSWYAGWTGYTMGMAVHFKHEGGGSDYATCHINVHAQESSDDSYTANATFVSIAALGLASACVGLFVKRRKERLASGDDNQSEQRTRELTSNFELVQDSTSSFV